jgi:hypothetical protein
MGAVMRMSNVTRNLGEGYLFGEKRKRTRFLVTLLLSELGKINGLPSQPRWGSGLHSTHLKAKRSQIVSQTISGKFPGTPRRNLLAAYVNQTVQKSTCGQHYRRSHEFHTQIVANPDYPVAFNQNHFHQALLDIQVLLPFQNRLHSGTVKHFVVLRTRSLDRRPLARIKGTELDASLIRHFANLTPQNIHLFDQVPFSQATHRR